jgi:hypothetical protein
LPLALGAHQGPLAGTVPASGSALRRARGAQHDAPALRSGDVTAGALLLSIVAVEWGGAFLYRVSTGGEPATDFQRRFYRAGHAHAACWSPWGC